MLKSMKAGVPYAYNWSIIASKSLVCYFHIIHVMECFPSDDTDCIELITLRMYIFNFIAWKAV